MRDVTVDTTRESYYVAVVSQPQGAVPEETVMEKLLLLITLLACPLGMLAMGAIGWFTAKVLRRGDRTESTTAASG